MTRIFFSLLIFSAICRWALAQETAEPVRVTVTTQPDGSRTETKIDKSNHTAESVTYGENNKVKAKVVYVLGANGQRQECTTYGPGGVFLLRTVYKHGESGYVSEELQYSKDDKLIRRLVYRYAADGKVAGIETFDGSGAPIRAKAVVPVGKPVKK